MKIINKFILNFFRFFGYNIKRIQKEEKKFLDFDQIYKKILRKKKIVIFDVGGNRGQSIKRFIKNFPFAEIHCFEPVKDEYLYLKDKFGHNKKIKLNNFALGKKNEIKNFYINAKSSTSSFNKLNKNSEWIKQRSKESNKNIESFTIKSQRTIIKSIDHYCKINKIKHIDILKLDTQGYEDQILSGSKNTLKSEKISVIELEMIFDNVYEKYLTFTDIEKNLLKNNYRFAGIETCNNNLFEGIIFFGDLIYINKKLLKLNLKH